MRQFIQGVLATLLAGVALFLVQQYIDAKNKASSLSHFTYKPSFNFTVDDINKWQGKFKSKAELNTLIKEGFSATAIIIENNGSNPIQDQDVTVTSSISEDDPIFGIIEYQNDVVPGGSSANTSMKLDSGALRISYKLLEPGEIHRFWVVTYKYNEIRVVARKPGLEVIAWNAKIYSPKEPSITDFKFGLAVLAIVFLFIGACLDSWITQRMLKRRGFDLVQIVSTKPAKGNSEGQTDG